MNLAELKQRFRIDAHDDIEPYFHHDEMLTAWLNDAVNEACIRGRLLHESQLPEVCQIDVVAGQAHYPLHESVYELSRIWFYPVDGVAQSLCLVSAEHLDQYYRGQDWTMIQGQPRYAIQSDHAIRLVPCPHTDGQVKLEGYRIPIESMLYDDDVPELHKIHHIYLVQWALHKAFSVPDNEFYDPNRAMLAEKNFTDYFGLRPDSDLRRITREDVVHHVVAFFP